MTWLKQSTAATIKLGPFVDDSDGKTAETALTISQADVRLSKNGGDFAQKNDANAATHGENGYYDVALNATDTGTLGRLRVAVSEAGALPVWADFEVVPAQVWDSFFASDRLQVDTRELGDSTLALTTQMKADVNAEADTALADYDGPTVAEMNARTLPAADYFDPATDTVAAVTTVGSVTTKTGYSLTGDYDAAKTAAAPGAQMDLVNAPNAAAVAAIQAGLALAATALSNATWTDARAALLDYLDAAVSSRLATASYTAPDNASIATLLDRLTALRAGYLDKLNVTGTLAHSDAANTYKTDVSALATQAAIDALDLLIDAIKAKTDLLPADPAGVSDIPDISALAIEATAQSIKTQTDQMVFTTPGKVDASAEATVDNEAIAAAVAAEVVDELGGITDPLANPVPGAYAEGTAGHVLGDLVDDVWSHTTRTLTSPATGADDSTTATAITRRRGDDWEVAISGLSLAGWQQVWFTAKRGYGYPDADAILQVTATDGLVRLNGAAVEAGDAAKAALVVNAGNDTATINVEASITAQLATGQFVYDLQWMDAASDIHTVSLGTVTISVDVTHATS